MTTPSYQHGCSAGSQVPRIAFAGDSDNAWNVNFSNGNSNWNYRNNNGYALAVRGAPREYQGAVTMNQLRAAYKAAAQQKCSSNQMAFEADLTGNLMDLQAELNGLAWEPASPLCFIATKPKTREIHAPDFRDRVVHHWLIPQLEPIWESRFIHDSYANRKGKGSHAAVRRLRSFVRQVQSGQGGGYFLQLDIRNFFPSINRRLLWDLIKPKLVAAGVSDVAQRVTHALLSRHPAAGGVRYRATAAERAAVPPHKRLENAARDCGLPIGNLSSQFFANVYLNELDQFVKHELKAQRYVRYVDDFVLVHHDKAQLEAWRSRIEQFLADRLKLKLKSDQKLLPLTEGIDFLGYVVTPTSTRVRRRVIAHARETLYGWGQRHVSCGAMRARPEDLRHLQAVAASFEGHLQHADSTGLRRDLDRRFPWLRAARVRRKFHHRLEGRHLRFSA